jgi:hypothetical protein
MLYQAAVVRKVVGVSQNLLSQWQDRRHVKPSHPATGQGTRNLYSIENICQIMLFKELNGVGFSRSESSILAFTEMTEEAFAGEIARQRRASEAPEADPKTSIHAVAFRDPDGKAKVWYKESMLYQESVDEDGDMVLGTVLPVPKALKASRSPVSVVFNLGVIASYVIEALVKIG